jgi:tRNA pseudouridine38-40 synthase
VRIALGIEYDGGGFAGWQRQPEMPTLQGALEAALAEIAGHALSVHAAGRTDRGVHASAQVVHFDSAARRPISAWVRGVNRHLPPNMAVVWAHPVVASFHARFSATGRHYRYLLLDHGVRPGLARGRVGWHHARLDVDAMTCALPALLGIHDFSSFRASECQAESPVREMRQAQVVRHAGLVEFRFSANGFLHHMVRNLVGSLVAVGSGRRAPDWLAEVLAARDRNAAAPTFGPEGLYLCGVDYPAVFDLPCFSEHGMWPLPR